MRPPAETESVAVGGWCAKRLRFVMGLGAFLGCVLAMGWHMRPEWTLNETYRYGWLVPVLAGYLFSVRWRDRPPAAPDGRTGLIGWLAASVLLLILWILHVAAPDWRLCGLGLAAVAVGVGLLWLKAAGGCRWVGHFGGAVGFLVLAAPWPSGLEAAVTRPLMAANAGLALEVLHWLGVPAVRSGSLISLPGSTLGVEEACSGIRSLQATLMLAVFLGELNRMTVRNRFGLLALGVLVALLSNVARTIGLSVLASREGPAAADRWHDPAGLIMLGVHGVILLMVAGRMAGRAAGRHEESAEPAGPVWPVLGPSMVLVSLVSLVPIASWWFGRQTSDARPEWVLVAPESASNFEPVPIAQRTRGILRFHDGWSARWESPGGHRIHAFFLEWKAGQVPPEILHSHQPGNCLTLAGMVEGASHGWPISIPVGPGITVPVRCVEFSDRGRRLFVFHGVDEQVSGATETETRGFGPLDRLKSAWQGRRIQAMRLVEIGIWNAESPETAADLAAQVIREQWRASQPTADSGIPRQGFKD